MKNYTITEEQIKKLSTKDQIVEEYLNEWFPEAFINVLELNKWYKWKGQRKIIGYVDRVTSGDCYGFKFTIEGICNKDNFNSLHYSNLELATEEEVKTALINEAKKRGYTNENTKSLKSTSKNAKINKKYDFALFIYENILYSQPKGDGGFCLFENGVWAEIIKEEITLNFQQIADKFGIDVDQLKITKL